MSTANPIPASYCLLARRIASPLSFTSKNLFVRTPVKDLTYKDLLTNTFTLVIHVRITRGVSKLGVSRYQNLVCPESDVCGCCGLQTGDSVIHNLSWYTYWRNRDWQLGVSYRFDDEVKDDAHGSFTPEMLKLPQATWITTFLEGVTDNSTGLPLFSELVLFAYKVSGVMCSVLFAHTQAWCWGRVWMTHYVIYYRGT
jgi:hypothetical protein